MSEFDEMTQRAIANLHSENNLIAEVCALQSAAARLMIRPETPYPRKPIAPVEEVLQLQLAARMLARRVCEDIFNGDPPVEEVEKLLSEALTEAQRAHPVHYLEPKAPA